MDKLKIISECVIEKLEISNNNIKYWIELFNACFEKRSDRDIQWAIWYNTSKYRQNDIYAIKHFDKIVTAYGLFPLNIVYNNQNISAYLVNNNMTHPDYTNKGLFTMIGSYVMNNVRTKDVTLLGIPNDHAIAGHRKVGWQELPNIPFFEITNLSITDKIKNKFILVDKFSKADDIKLKQFSLKYDFYIEKDSQYLNWRFNERPNVEYQIFKSTPFNGYVVLKHFKHDTQNKLHIVDFGYTNDEDFVDLIQLAISIAAEQKASLVNLWCCNTSEQNMLKDYGFYENGFNRLILHSDVNFLNDNIDNWHITLGDNDVY